MCTRRRDAGRPEVLLLRQSPRSLFLAFLLQVDTANLTVLTNCSESYTVRLWVLLLHGCRCLDCGDGTRHSTVPASGCSPDCQPLTRRASAAGSLLPASPLVVMLTTLRPACLINRTSFVPVAVSC